MDCEKYKEMISAQMDGELPPDEEAILDHHLKECGDCSDFQEKLAELQSLSVRRNIEPFPSELEAVILEKARKSHNRPGLIRQMVFGHYKIPKGLAWAAMILIIALAAALFSHPSRFVQAENGSGRNYAQSAATQKVIITEENVVKTQTVSGAVFKLKKGS
jgi:anti-sigma factor RsiW